MSASFKESDIHSAIDRKSIATSIADLFSPLTEIAGAIGDQVRVYRELNLKRTFSRAKKIAEEEGLDLFPPPLKFFVPFMEQCSLESEDDEAIASMWSSLLLSSATKYESEYNLFVRILGEMTSNEANALQYLVYSDAHEDYESRQYLGEVYSNWRDSYVYIEISDIIEKMEKFPSSEDDFAKVEKMLRIERQTPGCVISFFNVSYGEKNKFPYEGIYSSSRGRIDDDFDSISFAMLKSLGLIESYKSPEFWFGPYCFELEAWYVTELGARFYECCTLTDGWIDGGKCNYGTIPNPRFKVAFSFPGEYRSLIKNIALEVSKKFGKPKVFYDEYHQALLARPNLDLFLQNIYRRESELIVVFICDDYEEKEWCGVEWRAIRDLLKSKADDSIMFLKSGNNNISGLFSIDGYIDVNQYSPNDISLMIIERVEFLMASKKY